MWLTASAWLPTELLAALSRASGSGQGAAMGAGFGQDGPLDQLPPGPVLGAFLGEATAEPAELSEAGSGNGPFAELAHCDDSTLIGLIRGWRKQASLAAAAEHAAVAELAARRHAEAKQAGEWDSTSAEAADTEIAAALTLTSRAAGALIDRAMALRELPATQAALAAGRIDMPKALVLITGLAGQDPVLARQIEVQVIVRAPAQTTGELRAALYRALITADPHAAEKRRQDEEQRARIERAPEPSGLTATLSGRNLPVTATVAAWNRITELARQVQANGAPGNLDQLRVQVYLALLGGQATSTMLGGQATGTGAGAGADGHSADPAGWRDDDTTDPAPTNPAGTSGTARQTRLGLAVLGRLGLAVPARQAAIRDQIPPARQTTTRPRRRQQPAA